MKYNEPDARMGRMNSSCTSCRIVAVMNVFAQASKIQTRRRFRSVEDSDGTPWFGFSAAYAARCLRYAVFAQRISGHECAWIFQ